ncbi:hypothetical protein R1flu_022123 [Riccia fluitans]|uniref:Uncharacterized protein n=1 Tax=Riccia fluitans TaxID=41844 RepID=A0ABD1ZRM9_9MARC
MFKDMEALHAKIGMLEKEKKEMAERVQFIQRLDLYELLTDKLRGHQIRGHPYAIASWENVNLTCTRKNTTFLEDIDKFEANVEDYPELKHALEQNKGLTKYKEAGLHPEEFQGGDNEMDIATCNKNKIHLGLDVDRFLGHVPRATPGDEHTPSGEGGSDYIDELGPLTVARLRREFALLESRFRGNRPLTRAQARVLFAQSE